MKRIGFIVNPLAGIGGSVGLKGSDGLAVQRRALELGATPHALQRATSSLLALTGLNFPLDVLTAPHEMGETSAREAGFAPEVIGQIRSGATTAEDSRRIAGEMAARGVDLILFAGGDGTARDICTSVPEGFPCLGIPAGVKIHSAVYATNPPHAGELARLFLEGNARLRESEVLDLDEDAYREGRVVTRLYGYLHVPYRPLLLQNQKTASPASEARQMEAIAANVIEHMQADVAYILGPGTTIRAIARALDLEKTLVGVDVVCNREMIAQDVTGAQLLELVNIWPAHIIVTPIGGQGFLFGRGNQQIGPDVIRRVGRENIIVVSTVHKLNNLKMQPLLVDTGDADVDRLLEGYVHIITGYRERVIYRVSA